MKDAHGQTVGVGDTVLVFRPGGGGTIGKVVDVDLFICFQASLDIGPTMSQRTATRRWTEQAASETVLVLK